jgi:hypothetical protein
MAEMILVWIIGPTLLLLLSYGIGLSLTLVTRKPLDFTMAALLGFLLIIIIGSLLTISPATAPYTTLSIGLLSAFSFIAYLIWFRSHFRMDFVAGLSGLITYLVFGMPIIAYGRPSWAGWIKLDDPATFLATTTSLMKQGRSVQPDISSTYDRVIQMMFASGNGHFSYPIGSLVPFGVMSKLTSLEAAWLFQPFLSFAAALVAMSFVLILRSHLTNKAILILVSVTSAMASTIYSYVMWGAIKEIVVIVPMALFAFSLFNALKWHAPKEWYAYTFITVLALFFVSGTASVGFIAPIIFIGIMAKIYSQRRAIFIPVLSGSGVLLVLAVYYLKTGNNSLTRLIVPLIGDTGNLGKSLNLLQVVGIWPSQDFRMDPIHPALTFFSIAIALGLTIIGTYYSFKRGLWIVPSLLVSCVAVVAISYFFGGIWLTGKAIAVASPVFILSAGIGAYELWIALRKNERKFALNLKLRYLVLVAVVIVGSGVLISDVITYKNVWLAPFSQLDELRTINKLYAGQGPTLMNEYSVFGSRYFLRDIGTEAVSELRVHLIPTRDGNQVPRGGAADIDLFDHSTIDYFNLLVLRKAPNASRPPLNYELARSGTYYEVWKRAKKSVVIQKTLPLGVNFYPGAVPSCKQVSTFLSQKTKADMVFVAPRSKVYVIDFSHGDLPPTWTPADPLSGAVTHIGIGGFQREFTVDETRSYDLWIAGSFPGRLILQVDGEQVFDGGSVFEQNVALTNPLTRLHLAAGRHLLTLVYEKPLLLAGGDVDFRFGPIYLSTQTAGDVKVKQVSNSNLGKLCTQNLDWIAIAR